MSVFKQKNAIDKVHVLYFIIVLVLTLFNEVVAQTIPVSITASGPTTFCSPGSVTLSTLSTTGTTAQLAPSNPGTAKDCSCPAGYVVVGIQGRTGFWLDQYSLICQQINSSGVLFGATVVSNASGTSTGGGAAGPYMLPAGNVAVGGTADYYYYSPNNANYLEDVTLRGQTPAYVLANGNNATSPTSNTTLAGNQTPTGSLGTNYAPAGSVLTGMKAYDNGGYAAGVQWIYTPLTQLTADYLWSPGGQTTKSITVTTGGIYTVTATGGHATGSASQTVVIDTGVPSQPSTITPSNTAPCPNSTGTTYTVTSVANVTYAWTYSGTGATITAGNGTNSITVTYASATNGTWTATPSNTCGSGTARNYAVTLSTAVAAQPSTITPSNTAPCFNSTGTTYTVTTVAGVTYAWSYSGTGASITSGATTNSITVTYASATTGTWTVIPTNSCGPGTSRTYAVTFGPPPAQPSSFTVSDPEVCRGDNNIAYAVTPVSGATSYTWNYTGTGETISGGTTNSITVNFSGSASSGNMTVSAVNNCGTGTALTTAVAVSASVPGRPSSISNPGSICQGVSGTVVTAGTSTGATSYTWTYTGTGETINGSTASITIDFDFTATSGTLSVVGTNACGNSTQDRNRGLTINTAPAQPTVITPTPASPCNNSTGTTYSVPNVGGTTYAWSYSGTGSTITAGSTTRTITVRYINGTDGTWSVAPNNGTCTGPAQTLAVALQYVGTWTGTTSTAWATTTNWGCGTVPTATTDVILPSGVTNMPTVSTNPVTTRNLTINPSATLTNTSSGVIVISGNLVNNGTFVDNSIFSSTGVVRFNPSPAVAQTISGSGTTTFSNLTISNTAGVTLSSAATVNGILTLTAGTFATGTNLSQNLYTGAIAPSGGGLVSGTIRFFKNIYGDRYHYMSLPTTTTGLTDAEWNDDVTLKFGANSNLYSYDETKIDTNMQVGWTALTTAFTPLSPMTGYALFFPRYTYLTTVDVLSAYNHATTTTSKALTNTISTVPVTKPASDGWNFIGNPYPSSLDWTLVTRTGFDNTISMYDSRRRVYVAYTAGTGASINGGTQFIGSMQGFFVRVSNPGTTSLTLANSARVTSTLKDVWRTEEQITKKISLTLTSGNYYSDEYLVYFNQNATEKFDSEFDAYKMMNDASVPSLYSSSTDGEYAINCLPTDIGNKTIPLQLSIGSDSLSTWTANITGFEEGESIVLEDRVLGTSQELTENPTYAIQLSKGSYKNRFYLKYTDKQRTVTGTTDAASANTGIEIGSSLQNVVLLFTDQNPGNANIAIYDAVGNKVYEAQNANTSSGKINIDLSGESNGLYIVKVQTPTAAKSQQVFVQK